MSALVSLLLLAANLASPSVMAQAAYTPGRAVAEARPFGATILYNNANIGVGIAASSAQFSSTSAKARASFFSFGLAELVGSLQICGNTPFPPGAMPTPVTADTDEADGAATENSGGTDQGVEFAFGHARAAPNADAEAATTAVGFDIPGVVSITGGEAHARATSDPSAQARTATANTFVADVTLLDGAVRLTDAEFHLKQRSVGADHRTSERTHDSAFVVGGLELAGVPVPLPGPPEDAVAAVNTLIGPLGLELQSPRLVADGSFGHRLTPLTIVLGGSPAYGDLVARLANSPEVTQIQTAVQTGLFDATTCSQLFGLMKLAPQLNSLYNAIGMAAPILVAVMVSALSGDGQINIEIGGARTSIDDTYYPPPTFSRPEPVRPADPTPPEVEIATGVPPAQASSLVTPARVADPPLSSPVAVTRAIRCQTTSPAGRPGCWDGHAAAGALAALILAGGLLTADELRSRRHLNATPPEDA